MVAGSIIGSHDRMASDARARAHAAISSWPPRAVTAGARRGRARGSFGYEGHPPEDDSRRGDSAADFVNPTSRRNAVTAYRFQPRIESLMCATSISR